METWPFDTGNKEALMYENYVLQIQIVLTIQYYFEGSEGSPESDKMLVLKWWAW